MLFVKLTCFDCRNNAVIIEYFTRLFNIFDSFCDAKTFVAKIFIRRISRSTLWCSEQTKRSCCIQYSHSMLYMTKAYKVASLNDHCFRSIFTRSYYALFFSVEQFYLANVQKH